MTLDELAQRHVEGRADEERPDLDLIARSPIVIETDADGDPILPDFLRRTEHGQAQAI